MSTLTLVRHGQATFYTDNPDCLSEMGRAQASALGRYWAERGLRYDEAYCGALSRQRDTARLCKEAFAAAGVDFPEIVESPDFNEYRVDGALGELAPRLARHHANIRDLLDDFEKAKGGPEHHKRFQLMFEAIMGHWVAGEGADLGIESWKAFQSRVTGAMMRVTAEGKKPGKRIAVFTSGGVIGCTTAMFLRAPDQTAIEMNWRIRNASLTEFLFTGGRFSMDAFNALPHLVEAGMVTFR